MKKNLLSIGLTLIAASAIAQTPPQPPEPSSIIWNTNLAFTVKLAWDPSPDVGIAGYNLYRGYSSGSYADRFWCGTNLSCVVSNILPGVTNYFAATAVGTNQMESDFSNEVMWESPSPVAPPTLKLQIIVQPQYEISTNALNWIPAGTGPEVAFDAPEGWTEGGFVRVKVRYRTQPKTAAPF